jgi:hypothetical protein
VLLLYITIWCRREESVKLRLTNNTPHSGLFSLDLPVLQADTLQKLAARLARLERGVKGNPRLVLRIQIPDPESKRFRIPDPDPHQKIVSKLSEI